MVVCALNLCLYRREPGLIPMFPLTDAFAVIVCTCGHVGAVLQGHPIVKCEL